MSLQLKHTCDLAADTLQALCHAACCQTPDGLRFPSWRSISKQYVQGSCPDTRANNYAVASLNIVNKCTDEVMVANNDTCNNVINKGAHFSFEVLRHTSDGVALTATMFSSI